MGLQKVVDWHWESKKQKAVFNIVCLTTSIKIFKYILGFLITKMNPSNIILVEWLIEVC